MAIHDQLISYFQNVTLDFAIIERVYLQHVFPVLQLSAFQFSTYAHSKT